MGLDILRVHVFPGAVNIALIVGMEQGIFERHGLHIDLHNTPDSDAIRNGLAAGAFEIAHAVSDNAIAMVEAGGHDTVIVMGGDYGLVEFMARPEVRTVADVRGGTLAVDAPNTAYALVAKKILQQQGLLEGRDYGLRLAGGTQQRAQAMLDDAALSAGMLNAPFSITVREQGLHSLGQARDFIGPYQATTGFVMRAWAETHADVLERYIAAYVEALRLALHPAQREAGEAALVRRFKLVPEVARLTMAALLTPGFGLAPDAGLDLDGLRTVLALRAEMEGQWGGVPPEPDRYIDLGWYERALRRLDAPAPGTASG
ncbi:MAG: hypothetical protein V4505_04690 [Pseudomonadota bacterium]